MSLTNGSPEAAAAAAKTASFTLASLPASARNEALDAIHAALTAAKDEILAANARDLELARRAAADGSLTQALVSRLDLGKKGKWEDMLQGILDVRDLEDPGMLFCFYCFDYLDLDGFSYSALLAVVEEWPAQVKFSSHTLNLQISQSTNIHYYY